MRALASAADEPQIDTVVRSHGAPGGFCGILGPSKIEGCTDTDSRADLTRLVEESSARDRTLIKHVVLLLSDL